MDNWKTILTFTYPHEAHLAKNYLESEGIASRLKDELTAQVNNFYSNAIGGVKLQVMENDFDAGAKILEQGGYIQVDPAEPTWEFVPRNKYTDLETCPFCGTKNIARKKEPNLLTIGVYFVLGVLFPIFRKGYRCFDCNKQWKYVKQ